MTRQYFGMTLKTNSYICHTKKRLDDYPWFCCLRPINLSTQEKKEAVRRFKFPQTKIDDQIGENIIETSSFVLDKDLYKNKNKGNLPTSISGFDLVIPVPSTSSRPVDIYNFIEGTGPVLVDGMIIKNKFQDVYINQELLDSEPQGKKVEQQIKRSLYYQQKNHGDENYEAKKFPARYRRYLKNIFSVTSVNKLSRLVKGKNILITEDSIGEFVTAREIIQLLSPMAPRSILFFGCLRDYCSQDKYTNGSKPVNSLFNRFFIDDP